MSNELAELRAASFRQIRRRRWCEQICRLGDRLVWEAFEQLIRRRLVDEDAIQALLETYAEANPVALAMGGGDRMPALPVHLAPAPDHFVWGILAGAVECQ
jgi:hypothetical protein